MKSSKLRVALLMAGLAVMCVSVARCGKGGDKAKMNVSIRGVS